MIPFDEGSEVPIVARAINDSQNVNSNDLACGIGCFKPKWFQRLADPRIFLMVFCLTGVTQAVYFAYFIGILSTLERRYAFDTQVTGIILIADNLSPAIFGIFVGYYGNVVHRPRLVMSGMMLVVFSCVVGCLPYVIYGSAMHTLEELVISKGSVQELCRNSSNSEDCHLTKEHSTTYAVPILFLANFLNGFGAMAYYAVGTSYMDDSVKRKVSPLYLGFTFALRMFGPTLGFMLSSFCLKYYENPFVDPGFSNDDPRWVGAWWMGYPIIGAALFIFSFPMALFPRSIKITKDSGKSGPQQNSEENEFKDFFDSFKRLVRNPILVLHTISIVFQINGIFGYYVFMPKYMESQYQQTASSANFFSGTLVLITNVFAIFLGGVVLRRFKPRPRLLTGYMVFVEVVAAVGLISALFLGCPSVTIPSNDVNGKNTFSLNDCRQGCQCSETAYRPVCDINGTAYFSPCFGGCSAYNSTTKVFHNCSCVASQFEDGYTLESLSAHFCSENCQTFIPYFIVISLTKAFAATVRVGNLLVTLRCVDKRDKTLALGVVEFMISIFATIPYPLIYGYVVDTACLVWEESCGSRGNCWLYDREKFRHYLHGLALGFIMVGLLCDTGVFYYSKRLRNFYGKESKKKKKEEEKEEDSWKTDSKMDHAIACDL